MAVLTFEDKHKFVHKGVALDLLGWMFRTTGEPLEYVQITEVLKRGKDGGEKHMPSFSGYSF